MKRTTRDPPSALEPWVASIWHFEGTVFTHQTERLLPSAGMQILVNLARDGLTSWRGENLDQPSHSRGAILVGPFGRPIAIPTADQRAITGVSFKPGGAQALIGVEAHALRDDQVDLGEVFGPPSLREQMLEAGDAQAILDIWERILLAARPANPDRRIIVVREQLSKGRPVALVAREMGMSAKRFRRFFLPRVGLSPKTFARLERLQQVVGELARKNGHRVQWARLAQRYGFYDQAHLIREFQMLGGSTPTAYLPRHPRDKNHVAIL